jgi:hypothetical protein
VILNFYVSTFPFFFLHSVYLSLLLAEEAVEFSHRYSNKTADQMVSLYNESPEFQEAMAIIGTPEVQFIEPDGKEDPDAPIEHTYPTTFA